MQPNDRLREQRHMHRVHGDQLMRDRELRFGRGDGRSGGYDRAGDMSRERRREIRIMRRLRMRRNFLQDDMHERVRLREWIHLRRREQVRAVRRLRRRSHSARRDGREDRLLAVHLQRRRVREQVHQRRRLRRGLHLRFERFVRCGERGPRIVEWMQLRCGQRAIAIWVEWAWSDRSARRGATSAKASI
jgi:hypothetical protein